MDANRRRVLELAEQGEWDEVLELVEREPALAKAQDDFGMLPLHWACTEPSVPLETIKALLAAFPEACQLENLSGMAPLHVAIASKLTGLAINALLQTFPEAVFMKDGSGRYPIELAMDNNLPKFTIDLMRKAGARAVRNSAAVMTRSVSFDALSSQGSGGGGGGVGVGDDSDSVDGSVSGSSRGLDSTRSVDSSRSLRRWSTAVVDSSTGLSRSSSNNNGEESDDDVACGSKAELIKARSIGSLMASRQASEYARLLDEKRPSASSRGNQSGGGGGGSASPIGPIESTEISLHLKELLAQLQQLSVDLRSSSSGSGSTYRSSLSSSSSGSRHDGGSSKPSGHTVLWNPSDKLGFTMEPATSGETGARIKKLGSRSGVLGVEALSVGDVLVSINGTSVVASSFASITRFLKHAKVTCKLCFAPPERAGAGRPPTVPGYVRSASTSSTYSTKSGASLQRFGSSVGSSNQSAHSLRLLEAASGGAEQDPALLYARVAELLDTTLKKVAAVEETVRLSSAMSFCS